MTLPDLSLPERLLLLGADFTRHHDILLRINSAHPAHATVAAAEHIPAPQALARGALDAREAIRAAPGLYPSRDVERVLARMTQLATLAVIAADHLLDAVDLLSTAVFPSPGQKAATGLTSTQTAEAAHHIRLAGQLTGLGAEDCLAAAGLLARELRQWHPGAFRPLPALSSAQQAALEAVAAGRVTLDRQEDKVLVELGTGRITITTIRSLESRGLIRREPCALWLHAERLHLTTEGCQALAAVLGRPRSAPPATLPPAARPTAARAATR
ncbi:hypothetical protein AB0E62_35620 [Streptomyces sp. NPDC038707]|uniref:hypothetical protein n=1 Tax=Streptomyces sp. NPDC038707 TaxID=3154329 RepID=UPI0033D53632